MLNGIFYHGETVVGRIIDNEWQGVVSDIDIQTVANRVTLSRYGKNLFVMLLLLYTYRRCPYAMRARMALLQAGVGYQAYEVFTPAWVLHGFAAGS